MRRLLLPVLGPLLLATGLNAAEPVRILDVGLQGYYLPRGEPMRLRVALENAQPTPQRIELHILIKSKSPYEANLESEWLQRVELAGGETRLVDIPVLLPDGGPLILTVEGKTSSGGLFGRAQLALPAPLYDELVAILCTQDSVCQAVQSKISFAGTSAERLERGRAVKFVSVREPPEVWWAYKPASVVVVAAPVETLTEGQRRALEEFLRQGAEIILVESEIGDGTFLRAYREGRAEGQPQAVGLGILRRVPTPDSSELAAVFSGGDLMRLLIRARDFGPYRTDELGWMKQRLSTSLAFPSLGWLLAWLSVFLLVAGPLNFAILHKTGRREWGWITVPAISLLFAAGIYAMSAAQRPKEFDLDEVALYVLDDRSALAGAEYNVRVVAPRPSELELVVPSEAIIDAQSGEGSFSSRALSVSAAGFGGSGWHGELGPPRRVRLEMKQWSFRDIRFRGVKQLPGTVRWAGKGKLRNETGQAFRDALYVDKSGVYFLGAAGPGAEMDLSKARREPLEKETGRGTVFAMGYPRRLAGVGFEPGGARQQDPAETMAQWEEAKQLPRLPFRLVELIRGWPKDGGKAFVYRSGIFFGLAEEPVFPADLPGVRFERKQYAVTAVSLGPQP